MTTKIVEAVKKFNLLSKLECDTRQNLSGVKRKLMANMNATELTEFAEAIYAEQGPLGYDTTVLPAVKRG